MCLFFRVMLLVAFKAKLQEAEKILSFYYSADRLEFLKSLMEKLQEIVQENGLLTYAVSLLS